MKRRFPALLAIAALAALGIAPQATARDGLTPPQQRMRSCNTSADQKRLQGAERKHFMSSCLKGSSGNGRRLTAYQRRNEECNARAKRARLEGAARRGFMSECVKPDRLKRETAAQEKAKGCQHRAGERRLHGEDRSRYIAGCMDGAS